jgi:hypothetical protein
MAIASWEEARYPQRVGAWKRLWKCNVLIPTMLSSYRILGMQLRKGLMGKVQLISKVLLSTEDCMCLEFLWVPSEETWIPLNKERPTFN